MPSVQTLWRVAAAVFVVTVLCLVVSHRATLPPIWFPNAIIVYALLRNPRAAWPALLAVCGVAEGAGHFLVGQGLALSLGLPVFDLLEAVLIALPLRMMRLDRDFADPRTLLVFYLLLVIPAPAISSFLGAVYVQRVIGGEFLATWLIWLGAKALAQGLLLPLLMTVRWSAFKEMLSKAQLPGTILYLAMFAGIIVLNETFITYPFAFFFFPAVVLLTFQRGFAGGAVGTLIAGVYMIIPVLLGAAGSGIKEHSVAAQIEIIEGFDLIIGFSVILVGAALDRRRKLERGLAEAHEAALVSRDAAEAANRAKTMFLANMSHELRTPLNAVIGFSELMHDELYGPLGHQRYREYAGQIHEAGRHLLDLIGDILDMSKIEAGKYEIAREDIAVDLLVGDCLEMMREQAAQTGVQLRSEFSGFQTVHADRRALKQILLNLLSNAIKFTGDGGQVTVRSVVGSGKWLLSVQDTGVGIPPEELARLGNPFVQLRPNAGVTQQGTGLGLALVRGLAEMHDGTMLIDSENGKGTTVTIEIPLEQSRLAA